MPRRSRAREVVLQILYEDDLNPDRNLSVADEFLRKRLLNEPTLIEFAQGLLSGVRRNRPELDDKLTESAQNWSLKRMSATDRNVLRLGLYELWYTTVPGPVVINEAVDLARRYGTKQSAQFVNGVLDRFLKQKDEEA